MQGCFPVVGTAALALVAPEDPAVQLRLAGRLALDGAAGNATPRVDHARSPDGTRRAAVDAVAAGTAAGSLQRSVVAVGLVAQQQFAQQHIAAQPRRHQQRLPSDPSQTRLDGQLFLGQGRRIDEQPPPELRIERFQPVEQPLQHLPDRRMVVAGAGIGRDARPMAGRIAVARAILVAHGADHRRTRPLDQQPGIETLRDVALHVAQRSLTTRRQPPAEAALVVGQRTARCHPAEIEPRFGGKFFDGLPDKHIDILR